jgi:hypothetical protein
MSVELSSDDVTRGGLIRLFVRSCACAEQAQDRCRADDLASSWIELGCVGIGMWLCGDVCVWRSAAVCE